MPSLHFPNRNSATGFNLFAIATGAVIWFSMALFFFLVSWAVGGKDFIANIGGNVTLAILLLGLAVSAIVAAATKPER